MKNIRGKGVYERNPAVSYSANGNEGEIVPCLLITEAGK